MKRKGVVSRALALYGALLGLALLPAAAAEAPFATLTPAGGSVLWQTESGAPELVLSVSGPDVTIRQVSQGATGLSLSLTRADGTSLPDGLYKWEIRESYPGLNDGVHDPANGRDSVDAASAPQRVIVHGRVESGVFTIKNGSLVDSTLQEESAAAAGATDKEGK